MKAKRILSIFLSVALCLSLLPTAVFATENTSGRDLTASTTTLTDGDYYLSGDINLTTTLEINGTVNLYLNGHMLKGVPGNDVIRTKAGATLNLYDDPDSTITHEVIPVYDANTVVTVKGGLITGGGRGIQIIGGTTVHMYGGTIACNGSVPGNYRQHGGGVSVGPSATFVMHDGTIRNNIGGYGGGVNVNGSGGSFFMYDGKICDNRAFPHGGGVYINAGSFELHDGEISGNSILQATDGEGRSGGGVYIQYGNLSIGNGKVCENEAQFGGGVYVGGMSEVLMTSGEIRGNVAVNANGSVGGGVYLQDTSTFRMENGDILNNRAGQGGGIGMRARAKFELVDGLISGNYAASSGGGVELNGSPEFAMCGGRITSNSTDGHGGGVYVGSSATFKISATPAINGNAFGGTISSGVLTGGSDNNVYLASDALISVADSLSNATPIGVTTEDIPTKSVPVTITSDYDANNSRIAPVTFFASDNEKYQVLYNTDETEAVLALIPPPSHTATFMADGEVVDTITFDEGDATLSEPAVPAKTHYDGAWESYDLAAATDDITVNAVYTLNNSHSYAAASTVSPTCTEQGYTTYRCSICGDEYNGNYTAALGHDYHLNKSKSLAPAVGVEGYDFYECSHDNSHFYKTALPAQKATHTATFMIGDTVVAVVTFTEGDTTLSEPAIPDRANYVGAWDAYDLANATEDIVIQGRYTPVDPDAVSDLGADATATYANGVATITLSASAPSRTIKVTSNQAKPVDVVLVLDQSGSMADTLGARQSKRDALVTCANDFVTQLYQNAVATGADHRVALVGFAYSAYNNGKYANTGLLATTDGSGKNYASLKDADYKTALIPINNSGVINANVVAGINFTVADGATAADLGLKMAKNIFTENPANGTRERIVIFITDGTPTSWGETPSLITQTAADAISVANTIKNTQNAKIYSVGVEANTNPAAAFTNSTSGVTTDLRGSFVSYDFNRFLHAVSSNYPNAKSMNNMGDGDKSAGYYMAVNDTSSLGQIFTNILYNTVYELKTFDKATLFYTLTSDFTLTLEQELALRNRLKADYGLSDADITVIRNVDGTTSLRFQNVKAVQGYDASGNLCYTATVSFEVSANKDASGTVATGTSDSGAAYEGADAVNFTIPSVNITSERNIVAFTINGKVYRMIDLPLGSAITVPESELATWTIPDGTVVEGNYAVFEAAEVSDTYSIHWIIDGEETAQSYTVGDRITPPAVPEKDGFDFAGWSPSVPATMPLYSLICTAIYTPEHDHEWVTVYKTGTCDTGITTHYECICGKSKDETAEAQDHSFTAVLSDNGSAGNTVEKLVCNNCGYSKDQNVTFKVTYSQNRKTTVLDLNLYENEVSVTEPSQAVQMRFYIGDTGRSYTVTRIDPNGTRTTYHADPEDGYLVFTLDHFSVYVLSELDEATNEPVETLSYAESVQLLDAAQPVVDNTPLPENQNQNSGNTVDNTPSHDSSGQGSVWHGNSSDDSSDSGEDAEKPGEQKPLVIVFADVSESAYYYTAVSWAVRLGITNGTGDGTFSPNKSCSRAEIVTFLWRAKGSPEPTLTENPFDDLDEDAYYYRAALWAYENGITYGASATSFEPNADCTRAQAVTFLWRAENQPEADASDFVDVNGGTYYATAVNWAAAQEITNGTGNGAFSPDMVCSRAQIVTFLYRDLVKEIDKPML